MRLQTTANRVVEGTFNSPKLTTTRSMKSNSTWWSRARRGLPAKSAGVLGGRADLAFPLRRFRSRDSAYHFRTECSDPANSSLQGAQGTIEIGRLPLRPPTHFTSMVLFASRATIRISSTRDGIAVPLVCGYLVDGALPTSSLGEPEDFKTLAADRVAKGFNVVQIAWPGRTRTCPPLTSAGRMKAGFPWARDYSRDPARAISTPPTPADRVAGRFRNGFSQALRGGVGLGHISWLWSGTDEKHWRYLVGR